MENKSNAEQSPFVRRSSAKQSAVPSSISKALPSAQPVMEISHPNKKGVSGGKVFFVLILMILIGVGVGYGASFVSAKAGTSFIPSALNPNAPVKGKIYGNGDPSVDKDTAEGVLKNGGIDGDGQYHLVRSGGASQYVYLTSSSLDLSQFVNQKIKVWGQTQAAQHAGWLMDVGKVEPE
jgi:hypothetical protein